MKQNKGKSVNNGQDRCEGSSSGNLVPTMGKAWGKMANSRVAFAMLRKGETFSKAIDQLVRSNNDFDSISGTVIQAIEAISRQTHTKTERPKRNSAADINIIEKYKQIRSASKTLYHTLTEEWVCLSHQGHSVSVSFVDGNHQSNTIKFDVALLSVCEDASSPQPGQSHQSEPVWLLIEHSTDSGDAQIESASSPSTKTRGVTFASTVLDQLDSAFSRSKESVSITAESHSTDSTESDDSQQDSETDLIDLLSVSDYCYHFIQHDQVPKRLPQNECLGCLKGRHLQRFYLQPIEERYSGDGLSLASLISWVREKHYMGVLDASLAHKMAGDLAMSVLHFQNTPWLSESWRSKDVQFFNRGGFSKYEQLNPSSPRLQIEFKRQNPCVAVASNHPTHGELPFQFGIVLLELGLSRTWESLREEGLREFNLPERKRNDYHVAIEWWKMLKALGRVGPKYLAVTWNCITWDFSLNRAGDRDERAEEGDEIIFFFKAAGEIQHLNEGMMGIMQDLNVEG
ncbi:hypothetical protein QBC44DRAFT_302427 [Cladorrhinum sp. PSN332]|nr:hypothetical protein QBC44DRAFT_302427 [Cladorrhinum sp. PSN332]